MPSRTNYYSTAVWVQNGYFVLKPDIEFIPGDPGISSARTLENAVAAVVVVGAAVVAFDRSEPHTYAHARARECAIWAQVVWLLYGRQRPLLWLPTCSRPFVRASATIHPACAPRSSPPSPSCLSFTVPYCDTAAPSPPRARSPILRPSHLFHACTPFSLSSLPLL